MSSARQSIYILIFIALLSGIGLSISKLTQENSQYIASENVFIVPDTTLGETKIIDWETTEILLSNCQIQSIFQKRDLTVTLRDQNGQIYQVTEPEFNAISQLTKKYQGPCDIIQTISE